MLKYARKVVGFIKMHISDAGWASFRTSVTILCVFIIFRAPNPTRQSAGAHEVGRVRGSFQSNE